VNRDVYPRASGAPWATLRVLDKRLGITADNHVGMHKTMIVALARKLIIVLWRFVTTGEPLDGVALRPAA
jgi:hypothetical protein